VTKRPLLERAGVGFFKRRHASLPKISADDAVHVINAEERRAMRRIHNFAIARAAAVGGAGALIMGYFDAFVLDQSEPVHYWISVGILTGITAVLEIAFLYWDALRSVHNLAHAAGLDLFETGKEERQAVAAALARAALELPNPPERVFGVNPRREVRKLRLVLVSLLYKAKVGATNFVVKALIRRAMGRALVRGLLSFAAVPVTAAWNAWVAWRVLREARIRVLGPSAIEEMCSMIFEEAGELTPLGKDTVVRAIGSSIVRTRDMHPNLHHLLVHVTTTLHEPPDKDVDDPAVFLDQLARLDERERLTALRILNVASMIDGRLTGAETKLVEDALQMTGHRPTARWVKKLRSAFVHGDEIPREMVLRVFE
jgi:hypothetical protein